MLGDISAEALFAMTGEQLAAHIARKPTVIARRLNYLKDSLFADTFDTNPRSVRRPAVRNLKQTTPLAGVRRSPPDRHHRWRLRSPSSMIFCITIIEGRPRSLQSVQHMLVDDWVLNGPVRIRDPVSAAQSIEA